MLVLQSEIEPAPVSRKKKAEEGLLKLLGRDAKATEAELKEAHEILEAHKVKESEKLGGAAADAIDVDAMAAQLEAEAQGKKKGKAKAEAKKSPGRAARMKASAGEDAVETAQ